MAPRKTKRPGQGFSLYDLQDEIASVVETLADALSRQGVPVDRDSLLLSIQSVVKSIGVGASSQLDYSYPSLASDDEIPYSVAGDLLCIAHEYFQQGEKKLAVKNMITAMNSEDFIQIAQGLLEMNRLAEKSNKEIFASENEDKDEYAEDSEDYENTDNENNTNEDEENEDDSDLSDEELDELIDDSEQDVTADDEEKPNTKKESKENSVSEEEENNEESDKDKSKTEDKDDQPKKLEASHTSRVLANRISLEGHSEGRQRAQEFIKKHSRL